MWWIWVAGNWRSPPSPRVVEAYRTPAGAPRQLPLGMFTRSNLRNLNLAMDNGVRMTTTLSRVAIRRVIECHMVVIDGVMPAMVVRVDE